MNYVMDCKNKQIYHYEFNDGKSKKKFIKLSDNDFKTLWVMSNNHLYSLYDLSFMIFPQKRSLLYFSHKKHYYNQDMRNIINKLRTKNFNIATISNIGYRLEDNFYVK